MRMYCIERTSNIRNGPAQRLGIANPFIPRRLRYVEDLVNCWRDGNLPLVHIIALRVFQKFMV
jgi:hypothetical protein